MTAAEPETGRNAERTARWATAAGVGLLVLMPAWLVAIRVTALLWRPPVGPTVALLTALITCVVVAVGANRRLR
jgi:uncharacterized membrane protein